MLVLGSKINTREKKEKGQSYEYKLDVSFMVSTMEGKKIQRYCRINRGTCAMSFEQNDRVRTRRYNNIAYRHDQTNNDCY